MFTPATEATGHRRFSAIREVTYTASARKRNQHGVLTPVYRAPSQIPNAGQGLFTSMAVNEGDIITEYGGEILSGKEAQMVAKEKQSHFRVLLHMHYILDGSLHKSLIYPGLEFDEDYYYGWNLMASFANDPHSTNLKPNVKYWQINSSFEHLYPPIPQGLVRAPSDNDRFAPERIFLQALRRIEANEELLVSYGRAYWRDFIETALPPLPLHDNNSNLIAMCSVCATRVDIKRCVACGEHYCSKQCQTYDWMEGGHQLNCGVQSPLQPLTDNMGRGVAAEAFPNQQELTIEKQKKLFKWLAQRGEEKKRY